MQERVPVAVVGADPVCRAGVLAQLRYRPEIELVETDADPSVVVVVADALTPDLLVQVRTLRRDAGRQVVRVAGARDEHGVLAMVEAGAGVLLRRAEATPERLVTAVRAAAAGEGTLPQDLLGPLLRQVGALQRDTLGPRGLTLRGLSQRDLSVLRLLSDGASTAEIARTLAYSERTIKGAIHDLTTRLQLRNRTHMVAFAVREGLI